MKRLIIAAMAAFALGACGGSSEQADAPGVAMVEEDGVRFENAIFRPPFGGRDVAAAYLTITATGDQDVAILAARTDVAETTELHTHAMVDGMMSMRRVERYEIAAGETLELRTGAEHLMFFGLDGEFVAGDQVVVTLSYTVGNSAEREVDVDFTVDPLD